MKGIVEGIRYELPYLVTEYNLLHITEEWTLAWLDLCTTEGASISIPKMPTKPCTSTQTAEKITGEDLTPTTTGEKIDLEMDTAPEKNGVRPKETEEQVKV